MADWLTTALSFLAPQAAAKRLGWQMRLGALKGLDARGYSGARKDRLQSDWFGVGNLSSADSQLIADLSELRRRCQALCRDNPYAAAAKRNLTAQLIGDGIEAQAVHPDPATQALAQAAWKAWSLSKVDGRNDFFGVQKVVCNLIVEGGEAIVLWKARGDVPNARLDVLDGAWLDSSQNYDTGSSGAFIRAGVEINTDGDRIAYHLWNQHPGDTYSLPLLSRTRVDAKYVDHVFEAKWGGQVRGEPWFHAAIKRLHDVSELEEAIRVKKRVEACLALIRVPAPDDAPAPIGHQRPNGQGSTIEGLAPGMILTAAPGETMTVVDPSSSGDGDMFLRSQLMSVACSMGLPHYMLTGDVSQANYSSLRAAIVVFYSLCDDWQQNMFVPLLCNPAFSRCMANAALFTGNRKLLEVTARWTPPKRPWVDPLKDITAEIMEIRAFPGLMDGAYVERGLNAQASFAAQRVINDAMDKDGLASDADPRKTNQAGQLQPAAGFVVPEDKKTGAQPTVSGRTLALVRRSLQAEDEGDQELAASLLIGAAALMREMHDA